MLLHEVLPDAYPMPRTTGENGLSSVCLHNTPVREVGQAVCIGYDSRKGDVLDLRSDTQYPNEPVASERRTLGKIRPT
jgi:hypothetical protein